MLRRLVCAAPLLVFGCSGSAPRTVLRLDATILRSALTAGGQPGDTLLPPTLTMQCQSGVVQTWTIDLAGDDTFQASAPACGPALLLLDAQRAARPNEASPVAAYHGETSILAVPGEVDVQIPTVTLGELFVTNDTGAVCDLLISRDGLSVAAHPSLATSGSDTFALAAPADYAVQCGVQTQTVAVAFAERGTLTFGPSGIAGMTGITGLTGPTASTAPSGSGLLLGPSVIYDNRIHLYDASQLLADNGLIMTHFVWFTDAAEVTTCSDQPVCAVLVQSGAASFTLSVNATGDDGSAVLAQQLVTVQSSTSVTPAALATPGAIPSPISNSVPTSGGPIVLLANGALNGGTSLITSEPPPSTALYSATAATGTCTVTYGPGDCTVLVASSGAQAGPTVSCTPGTTFSTVDSTLKLLTVNNSDTSGSCGSIDLRGFGDVDVNLVFNGTLMDFSSTGDGVFVQTDGNVSLSASNGATFNVTNDGGDSGLVPYTDPSTGISVQPLIWLQGGAGKTVAVNGAMPIFPQSASAAGGSTLAFVVGPTGGGDALSDVVLSAQITAGANGGYPSYPASGIFVRGRRVFLPALSAITAAGAHGGANGDGGSGGNVFLIAEGGTSAAQAEQIYLSSSLGGSPLTINTSGGNAGAYTNSGSAAGAVSFRTGSAGGSGGGAGWIGFAGVVNGRGGDGGTVGGRAANIQVNMSCSGNCSIATAMAVNGGGGAVDLTAPANGTAGFAGAGGNIVITQTQLGQTSAAVVSAVLGTFGGSGIFNSPGGSCSPEGVSGPTSSTALAQAGYGGGVSVYQSYASPGSGRNASIRASGAWNLRGGDCVGGIYDAALSNVSCQPGGGASFNAFNQDVASLVCSGLQLDASGGNCGLLSSASGATVSGGPGGDLAFAASGPTNSFTLIGSSIALSGGSGQAAIGTAVNGGIGGTLSFTSYSGPVTVSVDNACTLTAAGGDASAPAPSQVTSVSPGAGGQLFFQLPAGSSGGWPASFSQCNLDGTGIGPAAGTGITSNEPSVIPGAPGMCGSMMPQ